MATKLTKKEKLLADKYIDTGNGTQSALEAYDTTDENSAAVIAHRTLRKAKIQEYIAEHAELAESKIFQLSQKAKSEMVSLVASKDILDRAGFKPVEKTQNVTITVEATPEVISTVQNFNEWFKGSRNVKDDSPLLNPSVANS